MLRIGAVLLAAGGSTRLGYAKQLVQFQGESLLRRSARTACESVSGPVIVVLGANAEQCLPELENLPVFVCHNPHWMLGLGASVRVGLSELLSREPDTESVLFLLCDQPLLTAEVLRDLMTSLRPPNVTIAACIYGETRGVPAAFYRTHFPELQSLPNEQGAKQILRRHTHVTATVPFPKGEIDIDTPQDYTCLCNDFNHR